MPERTSARAPATSALVAPRRCSTFVRPIDRSSSTSSSSCHTNSYGVMLVPRNPTKVAIHILLKRTSGTNVWRRASNQLTPTTNALTTYAKSDRHSHFTILANIRYDEKTSTPISKAPKATAHAPEGMRVTSSADADIPATSAELVTRIPSGAWAVAFGALLIGVE